MTEVSQGAGWWLASDGRWYPPHLHPDAQQGAATSGDVSSDALKPLRYGGTCKFCGKRIAPGATAWHDPSGESGKKVTCVSCKPPGVARDAVAGPRPNPVGGSSALRMARQQHDPSWQKGAVGEYLMTRFLRDHLQEPYYLMTDRRVPGTQANIDFVLVVPSGVWVIDAKKWDGTIDYKGVGKGPEFRLQLLVNGEDQTYRADKIYSQVIPVAQVLADPSIPIRPALVFIETYWAARAAWRFRLRKKPYVLQHVVIGAPRPVLNEIMQPGPLNADAVAAIGQKLDLELPPR